MMAVDFGGIFQGIQSARSLTVNEVNYWGLNRFRDAMAGFFWNKGGYHCTPKFAAEYEQIAPVMGVSLPR